MTGRLSFLMSRLILLLVAVTATALQPTLKGNRDVQVSLGLLVAGLIVLAVVTLDRWSREGRIALEIPLLVVWTYALWHLSMFPLVMAGQLNASRMRLLEVAAGGNINAALALSVGGLAWLAAGTLYGLGRCALGRLPALPAISWHPYLVVVAGAGLVALYFLVRGRELVGSYSSLYTEADPIRRLYNLGVLLTLGGTGILLCVGRSKALRIVTLTAVVLPALVCTVLLGSRWVIFSAFLTGVAAWSVRSGRLPVVRLGILFVVLVLAGTIIKDYRLGGKLPDLGSAIVRRHTFPLVEFFQEIGQTSAVVARTVNVYGDLTPYRYGETLAGAALSIIPSVPRILGLTERRPMYELAEDLFPQEFVSEGFTIGFSIVAELFLNFGVVGVAVGLFVVGLIFGLWYKRAVTTRRASVLFPLFAIFSVFVFGMRNDFLTWLRYAVWGGGLFFFVGLVYDRTRARRRARRREALHVTA